MTPTGTDRKPRMNNDKTNGKHDDLTQKIIGVFYDVYNELGSGFLESVYRESMRMALTQEGLMAQTEVPIPVSFRGELVGIFRADLIVQDVVLIELKACEALAREHESQTLNYLKATAIEVALLMNFGPTPRFKRLIMDNEFKKSKEKSVQSVPIGVKPLAETEVIA
jgi:GxxExxY protein